MTKAQLIMSAFAVLIIGVMLPVSSGMRSALMLALITLSVLTFIGGGMQYLMHLFN